MTPYARQFTLYLAIIFLLFNLSSCKVFKKHKTITESKRSRVVSIARTYTSVPYKFGGNDYNGIDCSGLICNVYQEMGIQLPRVSWQQAERGLPQEINHLRSGDLLFFITQKGGTQINHAGIVTDVRNDQEIMFIHAGSKGVREENLFVSYWRNAFAKAVRVLD